jgi:hypothetical protein
MQWKTRVPAAPGCNTIHHPLARYPEAFTVGSTTHTTDTISDFSSRGPAAIESAIYRLLSPGQYTAIVRGKNNGVGIVEIYNIR